MEPRDITVSFVDGNKWSRRYQRNNKRTGLKNLRCFPFCSDEHKVRGFCGRSVSVGIESRFPVQTAQLLFFAEFTRAIDTNEDYAHFPEGSIVSGDDINSRQRTKESLGKPWFTGDVLKQQNENFDCLVVEFNQKKKGWHYGWTANKHTCELEHILRVFIMHQVAPGQFKVVKTHDSPTFTIFCRRRQRDLVPNLPAQIRKQLSESPKSPVRSSKKQKTEPTPPHSAFSTVEALISLSSEEALPADAQDSYLDMEDTLEPRKTLQLPQCTKKEEKRKASERTERKKRRRQAEKMIWRVIQALLRLDFNKENMNELLSVCCEHCREHAVFNEDALIFSIDSVAQEYLRTGGSLLCQFCKNIISPKSSLIKKEKETSPESQDQQDYGTLTDFLDTFLPEISSGDFSKVNESPLIDEIDGGSLSSSPLISQENGIDDNGAMNLINSQFSLDLFPSINCKPEPEEIELNKDQVLEDLGRFLIDENCLTKAIDRLLRSDNIKKKSFQDRKSLVLGVFAEQIQIFLNRFGIGLDQFDFMLQSVEEDDKSKSLTRRDSQIASPVGKIDYHAPPETPLPCFFPTDEKIRRFRQLQNVVTGDWTMDDRISTVHEMIRQDLGIPWLVRKMMSKMEKVHSIWFLNVDTESVFAGRCQLVFGGKGKLLSSGQSVYTFDGNEHKHNLVWPLPVQNAEQKEQTVPTSRAYIDYNNLTLILFHNYGRCNRTVRRLGITEQGRLLTEIAYEVRENEHCNWRTKFHYRKIPLKQYELEQLG